jgi:hypothetical protein
VVVEAFVSPDPKKILLCGAIPEAFVKELVAVGAEEPVGRSHPIKSWLVCAREGEEAKKTPTKKEPKADRSGDLLNITTIYPPVSILQGEDLLAIATNIYISN